MAIPFEAYVKTVRRPSISISIITNTVRMVVIMVVDLINRVKLRL